MRRFIGYTVLVTTLALGIGASSIAYADYQDSVKASVESSGTGYLGIGYDVKEVSSNPKNEASDWDASGPIGKGWGDLEALTSSGVTGSSGGFSSYGDSITSSNNAAVTAGGVETSVPSGLGSKHGFSPWQKVSSKKAKALVKTVGMNFDNEGFGKVNGRYVVKVTSTFGDVGDYVDFYQTDGTKISCVIGETLECDNKWGSDGGKKIVNFLVNRKTWYTKSEGGSASKKHAAPGSVACHPEWNKALTSCYNSGSIGTGKTSTDSSGTNIAESTNDVDSKTSSERVKEMVTLLDSYSVYFKKYSGQSRMSRGHTTATFSTAKKRWRSGRTVTSNCVTVINWALRDMDLQNHSGFHWAGSWKNVSKKLDKVTKRVTKANGMTVRTAAKKGYLQYGDIIGMNLGGGDKHTFVYAGTDKDGNPLCYESGGDAYKKMSRVGCGPFKLGYKSYKIAGVLRFK